MTIDITPEAVERLAASLDRFVNFSSSRFVSCDESKTLRALSAALTASQAETAAVYEAGRADGMREAAAIVDSKYAAGEMGNPGHHILAAIQKGTDHE